MTSIEAEHPEEQSDRLDRLTTVQTLLQKERIDELSWEDARSVTDRLHAMDARQLNKYKFLNPSNNSIEVVRSACQIFCLGATGKIRGYGRVMPGYASSEPPASRNS